MWWVTAKYIACEISPGRLYFTVTGESYRLVAADSPGIDCRSVDGAAE
jgi:hypothetical protein